MTRHNLCPNPAVGVDVTGWGGGATPTRTAVTGFLRDWAARYAANVSFVETPRSDATAGLDYTLSLYAKLTSGFATSGIRSFIGWYNASGGAISFDQLSLPDLANGVVTRLVRTGTAPAGTAKASLVFDSMGGTFVDFTAMLVEQDPAAQAYADGDTAGWEWDGTPGLSSSSESVISVGLAGRVTGRSSSTGSVVAATSRSLAGAIT